MNSEDLERFRTWFKDYCLTFYSSNEADNRNIRLKEEHTFRVCLNMDELSESICLDANRKLLASTAALFHDLGRFPQYAKYKTFRDSVSVNHGLLGAQTLIENRTLRDMPEDEQAMVLEAIRFHNAYTLARTENPDALLLLKLVRDADKLDIWEVFTGYYGMPPSERPTAVALGLKDIPEYSDEMLDCIAEKRLVRLIDLKTLNDFRLLQLSWIFDLNFRRSFTFLRERGYVNAIADSLPQNDKITKTIAFLNEHVRSMADKPENRNIEQAVLAPVEPQSGNV